MPPPISEASRTIWLSREGGVVCARIMYTQRGSVGILQVTGSLLFVIILCCCVVLCCHSPCVFLPRLYCISLTQSVCGVIDNKLTVSADYSVIVIASDVPRPSADRSGIDFQVRVQIPLVTLDMADVVVLDTSHVPDVLGFRTRNAEAELVREVAHLQTAI